MIFTDFGRELQCLESVTWSLPASACPATDVETDVEVVGSGSRVQCEQVVGAYA